MSTKFSEREAVRLAVACAVIGLIGGAGMVAGIAHVAAPEPTLPACTSDDGQDGRACYWDAAAQGDGQGTSFVALADGTIVPLAANVCAGAAMLAHDAYVTGEASVDLDAAMRECADSVGGL